MEYEAMNNMISLVAKELASKKEKLIFDRFIERANFDESINLNEELKRRFPRLAAFRDPVDQSESYYWNDGSENGLHLITFYYDNQFDYNSDTTKIGAEIKYK